VAEDKAQQADAADEAAFEPVEERLADAVKIPTPNASKVLNYCPPSVEPGEAEADTTKPASELQPREELSSIYDDLAEPTSSHQPVDLGPTPEAEPESEPNTLKEMHAKMRREWKDKPWTVENADLIYKWLVEHSPTHRSETVIIPDDAEKRVMASRSRQRPKYSDGGKKMTHEMREKGAEDMEQAY
jgi:hypothetical protein